MNNCLDPIRSMLTLSFLLVYLVNIFLNLQTLTNILAFLIVWLLVINLPYLKSINKYVSLVLLLCGSVLLINCKADIFQWVNALTKNTGLICLLTTVPLLGIPLNFENFRQALADSAQKYLNVPASFYLITNILSYSIGMLLNLAGISIVYQLLNQAAAKYPRNLFITALTRGYGCCVFWSPNFISVAVILHYLKLPWLEVAPWGFLFAGISIFVAYILQKINFASQLNENAADKEANFPPKSNESAKLLHKLVGLGLFLLFLIIILEYITGESVLVIVPLLAITFPYLVALLWRKQNIFYPALRNYYTHSLPRMKNEIVLFAVAGFFGQSLIEAGVGDLLAKIIEASNIESSFLYIVAIIGIMVLPSLIGIHPVVSGSTIAVTVPVSILPLMPIQYALTLLTGWTLSIILSPFSGTVLVTAGMTSETPFKVGIGWNWRYALILTAIYVVILPLINR